MLVRIAIIGSGIAGMTAAYRLNAAHDITVFEASDHFGGHTYTRDIEMAGQHYAVDMGFIVFNDRTYPSFVAMMNELGVESQPSNMSFSLRCERTGLEYNGTSLNSLFAQRLNLVRPSFLRMIADILRFNRESPQAAAVARHIAHARGVSRRARLLAAVHRAIHRADGPGHLVRHRRGHARLARAILRGLLRAPRLPHRRTIARSGRPFAAARASTRASSTALYRQRIRLRTPVQSVKRTHDGVMMRTARGEVERFDYVVFACHSDQALAMLDKPTPQEAEILGAFPYQPNEVVLHTDTRMLPRTPLARAAWNYHALAEQQERGRAHVRHEHPADAREPAAVPRHAQSHGATSIRRRSFTRSCSIIRCTRRRPWPRRSAGTK